MRHRTYGEPEYAQNRKMCTELAARQGMTTATAAPPRPALAAHIPHQPPGPHQPVAVTLFELRRNHGHHRSGSVRRPRRHRHRASGGIGAAITTRLAADGMAVVVHFAGSPDRVEELRRRDITVNAVAPGPTATPLFLDGKDQGEVDGLASMSPAGAARHAG